MSNRGPKIRDVCELPGSSDGGSFSDGVPAYLSDCARAEYARLVGILDLRGRLPATDPRLLELFGMNYDICRLAYDKVMAEGATVESDRGNASEHPAIQTLNAATIRLKAILVELGLTPSTARAYIGEPPKDELALFLEEEKAS